MEVTGTIFSDTTWYDDVKIHNSLTVAAGATLTINPGVTVYMKANTNSRLLVDGTLHAEATGEEDRIIFTSDNASPAGGDWHYISFNDGSTGSLKYVTIEYAGTQSNYAGVSISTAALLILQFTNLRSRYPTPYRQQFR